jgi:putative addiction module component (TIGR02574 family)
LRTINPTTIEREALHLPVLDRAKLAHKLLLSLDDMSEHEVEEVWLDEAERRAAEIDQGLVQLIPAEEVSRKARALLK